MASKASGSSSGSSTDLLRPGGWLFCTLLLPQRQRPFTCHNMPACLQHCSTCPTHLPAGPGAFDFTQSDTNGTAFWRLVRNFITKPTPEQEACHAPKPILLDVGEWLWGVVWGGLAKARATLPHPQYGRSYSPGAAAGFRGRPG